MGTVSAVGSQVRDLTVGQRVGIGWQADSCGICEWCRQGDEHLCAAAQPTCVGRNGGYADSIRVNSRFAIPVPEALESENVAPLLCAGITVYSPMRNLGVRPSSRVGIIGIGGLGHLGLQFAKAFGAEVTAFSTSTDKEEEARRLGAHHFVNTRDNGALKKIAGSFDLLLSTVGADQDWQAIVNSLRPKGTLCIVGVPPSPISIQAFPLIAGQRSICWQPHRQPARSARDAGRGRPPRRQGHHRALPHGQGQRGAGAGQEEPGPLPRRPHELKFKWYAGRWKGPSARARLYSCHAPSSAAEA